MPKLHCDAVSEVLSELCTEYWPGVRFVELEAALLRDALKTVRSPWLQEVLSSMPEVLEPTAVTVRL